MVSDRMSQKIHPQVEQCLDVNCAHRRGYDGCQFTHITIGRHGHCGNKVLKAVK